MPRCDALDWMKALGISLIVYGHVAHATTVPWTPPIYVKQLGVALFLFATGFTLARERRGPVEVLFNRLFPVYLFGLATAAAVTICGLIFDSGLAPSNYLPFLGGANVLFDNFPANPSTWYLGTYLHLLVVWAVWLRRVRVSTQWVLAALVLEVPIRAALMAWAGPYVAYMLLTNWSVVFLAGLVLGGRPATETPRGSAAPYVLALAGGLAAWTLLVRPLGFTPTFPFMTLERWPSIGGSLVVSAAVSVFYVSATLITFEAVRRVAAPRLVPYLARHSLIIFLVHMPVFLALNPVLAGMHLSYWARVAVQLAVCLPGLACLSAVLMRVVRPKTLGAHLLATLEARRPMNARAGDPLPSLEHR